MLLKTKNDIIKQNINKLQNIVNKAGLGKNKPIVLYEEDKVKIKVGNYVYFSFFIKDGKLYYSSIKPIPLSIADDIKRELLISFHAYYGEMEKIILDILM